MAIPATCSSPIGRNSSSVAGLMRSTASSVAIHTIRNATTGVRNGDWMDTFARTVPETGSTCCRFAKFVTHSPPSPAANPLTRRFSAFWLMPPIDCMTSPVSGSILCTTLVSDPVAAGPDGGVPSSPEDSASASPATASAAATAAATRRIRRRGDRGAAAWRSPLVTPTA